MMYSTETNHFYTSSFRFLTSYYSSKLFFDLRKKNQLSLDDSSLICGGENIPGFNTNTVFFASNGPLHPPASAGSAEALNARSWENAAYLTDRYGMQRDPRAPQPSPVHSVSLKFGIDRILSTEFDIKAKESTLRDGSAREAAQHQIQDSFPGPYAVLAKAAVPQANRRKRSWSRAVFSNLQRKGLEKRFEVQKYVTKPDRKQLAAMLGLTDAQVKVWFQNRRMKWRHSKETQAQKHKTPQNNCLIAGSLKSVQKANQSVCESEGTESDPDDGQPTI